MVRLQNMSNEPAVDTTEIRRERLKKLRDLGINPYPHSSDRQQSNKEAKEMMDKQVVVAGRIMGKRGHGKLIFVDLIDESDPHPLATAETDDGPQVRIIKHLQ